MSLFFFSDSPVNINLRSPALHRFSLDFLPESCSLLDPAWKQGTMTEKEISISQTRDREDADSMLTISSWRHAMYWTQDGNKFVPGYQPCCRPEGDSVDFHRLMDIPSHHILRKTLLRPYLNPALDSSLEQIRAT